MAQWFFKSDLRFKGDEGWTPYTDDESRAIERAYQDGRKNYALNAKYRIRFDDMVQHRTDDESRQRAIKREARGHDALRGRLVWIVTDTDTDGNCEVCGVYLERSGAVKKKDSREDKLRGRGAMRTHTVIICERPLK
eukprot:m51a1_g5678 hypothetical protein (137) ;mRNA; f:965644-966234